LKKVKKSRRDGSDTIINAMTEESKERNMPGGAGETNMSMKLNIGDLGEKGQHKPVDKEAFRAQKEAERETELAEKEAHRAAEKAQKEAAREAELAEKEALREAEKAEREAERAKHEKEKLADQNVKHPNEEKEAPLKKRIDTADNSTNIGEDVDGSTTSLQTDQNTEAGWMPTPSPIAKLLASLPNEQLICPDKYDPERIEPYKAGDQVSVNSSDSTSIFECQGGEFETFCSIDELDDDLKKEKHAEKLWKEAWKYVGPCSVDENAEIDGALEGVVEEAVDQGVVKNGTVEADIEDESDVVGAAVDEEVEMNDTIESDIEEALVVEGDTVEEIESAHAADGALDVDSLPGLEQHNWDMGLEFAEEPCVNDVCNYKLSDICLLKYQVNVQEANEPNTITMELICEGVTWLGIGFSQDGKMIGSEAVIGVPGEGVQKYSLGGKWLGGDGVTPMPKSQQTLIDASITVYRGPITVLKFTKIMSEQNEKQIKAGTNTFLYAQGQSYFLGQHSYDSRGSFQLDLPYIASTATASTVASTTTTSYQPCSNEWCTETLSSKCTLKYLVNYLVDKPSTITMDLTCDGENWIGIGFSTTGTMVGSEAVIAGGGQEPMKYYLGGKWAGQGGVMTMPEYQQTLIDASAKVKWINSSGGLIPKMRMRFTKIMKEEGEIEIKPGHNLFLYAQGQTPSFPSYHTVRNSFSLTLPSDLSNTTGGDRIVSEASPEMEVTVLSPECSLKHVVNVPAYTTKALCQDCSITMELTCENESWLAVGFSSTGSMPRSEAVIGIPGWKPEKYYLKKRDLNYIQRLPEEMQTLTDASVMTDDGKTVMKFTKLLSEADQIQINQGVFFLYARGYDETLGWHGPSSRGSFQLNLQ
jgi:hypothetical protein